MTNYDISIVSDTVCPWCYIGFRLLQAGISQHLAKYPDDTFVFSWHPFQLNPHAPKGRSIEKTNSSVNVLKEQPVEAVNERLRSAGKDAGINFKFNRRTGNTLDSHRIIEFACQKDAQSQSSTDRTPAPPQSLQTRLVEELFADYFERQQDIFDHDVLAKAAGRAGLDEDEVKALLTSYALSDQVEKEAKAARGEGVNGVPHFTINDMFDVEGAQEPNAFLMLFERLKKRGMKGVGAIL